MNNDKAFKLVKEVSTFLNYDSQELLKDTAEFFTQEIEKKSRKYPRMLKKLNQEDKKTLIRLKDKKVEAETSLEKALLALLWKQGDYTKLIQFIQSLEEPAFDHSKNTGHVFHQFAQYISSDDQPIIDQHVLRAYLTIKLINEGNYTEEEFLKIRRFKNVGKGEIDLIQEYRDWINRLKGQNLSYDELDDYLFILGKKIKLKN